MTFRGVNLEAQIRAKNVAAIRTLLDAALTSGNTMNHLWRDIFVCISQMEKLQLLNDDLVDLANTPAESPARTYVERDARRRGRRTTALQAPVAPA